MRAAPIWLPMSSGWKNNKHVAQWRRSVEVETKTLHRLKADRLKPEDVALVLQALADTPETMHRCRNRIELIIDAELARLQRFDEKNPAQLRVQRHLVAGLSKRAAKRKRLAIRHHTAPTLDQVRAVWRGLDWQSASHLALRWIVVTLARTTEVRFAIPAETDLRQRLWKLPAGRMKNDRPHTVPLNDHALIVLARAREEFPTGRTDYLFPGLDDEALDINSMRQALQRLIGRQGEIEAGERLPTPHGIRATFRSWVRSTGRNETIAELCLAHEVDSDTIRAYTHGAEPLELQRKMLEEWAHEVCGPAPARILSAPGTAPPITGPRDDQAPGQDSPAFLPERHSVRSDEISSARPSICAARAQGPFWIPTSRWSSASWFLVRAHT